MREGVNVTIPTLSANEIQLRIQPKSRMVTQQKCKVIPDEGMPVRQSKVAAAPQVMPMSRRDQAQQQPARQGEVRCSTRGTSPGHANLERVRCSGWPPEGIGRLPSLAGSRSSRCL